MSSYGPESYPEDYILHPEEERGAVENPQVVALLGSAGLNAVDLQLFDRLHQQGQDVFVHGSIMADRITPESDIDFTIIGKNTDMSSELRDTLMPGLDTVRGLHTIDYTSTSIRSQDGRKVSMHISEPTFRDEYPTSDKPYATEYRPGIHAKTGPRSYFLSGADRDGHTRLVHFLCDSIAVGTDGSTVTDVPQTGRFMLKGNTVFVDGKEKVGITADKIIRLTPDGETDSVPADSAEEVMVLGLEFDKMQSDTPVYRGAAAEQRFVRDPITRSMESIGDFTKVDPAVITNRLFGELARHWASVKPHKSR